MILFSVPFSIPSVNLSLCVSGARLLISAVHRVMCYMSVTHSCVSSADSSSDASFSFVCYKPWSLPVLPKPTSQHVSQQSGLQSDYLQRFNHHPFVDETMGESAKIIVLVGISKSEFLSPLPRTSLSAETTSLFFFLSLHQTTNKHTRFSSDSLLWFPCPCIHVPGSLCDAPHLRRPVPRKLGCVLLRSQTVIQSHFALE